MDKAFQRETERRLRYLFADGRSGLEDAAKDDIKSIADELTYSRRGLSFQHFVDYMKIRLPDILANYSCPEIGVEGGRMTFS